MTTLEKMARALCTAAGNDPDLGPSHRRALWRTYLPLAEAALMSIREPTEALAQAMNSAVLGHVCLEPPLATDARLWTAGIDAIREGRA